MPQFHSIHEVWLPDDKLEQFLREAKDRAIAIAVGLDEPTVTDSVVGQIIRYLIKIGVVNDEADTV